MYRLLVVLLLLALSLDAFAASLCGKGEVMVFSCKINRSAKVVSLCATVETVKGERRAVSLVYRFGKADSLELEFPSSRAKSLQQFRFSHYFRPRLDSTNISFKNESFMYGVYDTVDDGGSDEKRVRTAGVSVSSQSHKMGVEMSCDPGSVAANWPLIDGVVPCEEDEGFPNSCHYTP